MKIIHLISLCLLSFLVGCTTTESSRPPISTDAATRRQVISSSMPPPTVVHQPRLLMVRIESMDLIPGTGAEAVLGKKLTIQYVGRLSATGEKFDSSFDRGYPFVFVLGAGQVIKGLDEGIQGMKVGGKRQLDISPELAYGAKQVGSIPPNSRLEFTVELISVD